MKSWPVSEGTSIIRVLSGGIRVFLLTNGMQSVLIDTGMMRHRRALERKLRKLGVEKIALLVLTHAHYDHAGNAAMIKEKYGATVAIHRLEADLLVDEEYDLSSAGFNAYLLHTAGHSSPPTAGPEGGSRGTVCPNSGAKPSRR